MQFFFSAAYCVVYAHPLTDTTAITFLWINGILDESLAHASRTFLLYNVRFVFLAEIAQRREHGICSGLAQSTKGRLSDRVS